MAYQQPSHRPSSTDLAGGLGVVQQSQGVSCAPLPLHSQSPLLASSPRLSVEFFPSTASVQKSTPSAGHRAPPAVMRVPKPGTMQWATSSNLPPSDMGQDPTSYHIPMPFAPGSSDFYHYYQNGMSYTDNSNLTYLAQYPGSSCPRSYSAHDSTGLPSNFSMPESYPPAAYQIEPQKHHDALDLSDPEIKGQLMQLSNDYEQHHYGPHIKIEDHGDYQSPYSDFTPASTPGDDPPMGPHDHKASETGPIDKEQPYAQLIYKALLDAPDNTMVLRDIYEWFMKHTDKAADSETKGWQNSIRHNLSMNGAFEKVDQQPREESGKGFMWRLTKEALRDGVKSTTRYRSKQPNKRGHRTQHPQPQRQASGAKGGQAARRSARVRRSNRVDAYRSDPYASRSVPVTFDPTYNGGETSIPYTPSPYYDSEVDFGYGGKDGDFDRPLAAPGIDLFPTAGSYAGSPMLHGLPLMNASYVLDQSPTESLFTNSPTPSTDEPKTPVNQGVWDEEVRLVAPGVFDELAYRNYAG